MNEKGTQSADIGQNIRRRRSHVEFDTSNASRSDGEIAIDDPPNNFSTPLPNYFDNEATSTGCSTPQSNFRGFNSAGENNEHNQLQNNANVGGETDIAEPVPNDIGQEEQVPLRRSTRLRRRKIIFTPE
ncbi:hypothetical protein CVS40_10951 [Lucilia cuprina]|nr:hypothetical protein CVS40_10951 [Lucilia cuprina]